MISKKAPVKAAAKGKIGNLVSYLLDPKGKADRVAAVVVTNCQSDDSRWAVHEMQAVQDRNQRAKGDKTYHLVISFRDGEDPSPQVLAEIESEFCVALGFTDHQRISVIHRDTDNLHIHVAINKVHATKFTLHEPFNDYHTRSKLCGQLERRYGLEIDRAKTARDVPANERAATMEAVAGVESLIGYVQRSLKGAVAAAGSWQELHEAFAKAGVALKPRGNGLVVESGGKSAKASSCFRELSKTALEKRFGSFQEKGQQQAAQEATPKKAYRVAPMQRDGGKLYEQYQLARLKAKEAQTGRLSRALDAHRARVARATAAYKTQRTIIGLTRRSTVNTIMLQLHRAHLKGKLAASFATYKAERSTIYRETKLLAWNDWLMNESAKGSKPALLLLQSRRAKTPPPPGRTPAPKPNVRPNYNRPGIARAPAHARPDYNRPNATRAPHPVRPDYGRRASLADGLLQRAVALLQSRLGRPGGKGPARPLASVRDVSNLDVVYDRPGAEVLLRPHEPDRLGSQERGHPDPPVRRPGDRVAGSRHEAGPGGGEGRGKVGQSKGVTHGESVPYATRGGTLKGIVRAAAKVVEQAKEWTRGQ